MGDLKLGPASKWNILPIQAPAKELDLPKADDMYLHTYQRCVAIPNRPLTLVEPIQQRASLTSAGVRTR
jgi:hypothetical protein